MTKILLAAILALGTTTMAFAAPVEMTATQLDQVTAGVDVLYTAEFTDLPETPLTITGNYTISLSGADSDVASNSDVASHSTTRRYGVEIKKWGTGRRHADGRVPGGFKQSSVR